MLPTVVVENNCYANEDAMQGYCPFLFSRTGDTSEPLTVLFTLSGSATEGVDYATLPRSVTFAAGRAIVEMKVDALTDEEVEGNETILLTLVGDASYGIGERNQETCVIYDCL